MENPCRAGVFGSRPVSQGIGIGSPMPSLGLPERGSDASRSLRFPDYCRIERRLADLTCSVYERDVTACVRFLNENGDTSTVRFGFGESAIAPSSGRLLKNLLAPPSSIRGGGDANRARGSSAKRARAASEFRRRARRGPLPGSDLPPDSAARRLRAQHRAL